MEQNFFNWGLSNSNPLRAQLHWQHSSVRQPLNLDFHEALHITIRFAGKYESKAGNCFYEKEGIVCYLVAPWEPHGSISHGRGSLLLMTAVDPKKILHLIPGYEEKFQLLLQQPPEKRTEFFLKYIPHAFFLEVVEAFTGKALLEKFLMCYHKGEVPTPHLVNITSASSLLLGWNALGNLLTKLLIAIPDEDLDWTLKPHAWEVLVPVFQCMAEKPFRRLSAEEGAELCNVSLSSFRKLFRQAAGCAFAEFERNSRLMGAVAELSEKKLIIKELSEKYGFYDMSHFIHLFRGRFGKTPHAFVAELEKDRKQENE